MSMDTDMNFYRSLFTDGRVITLPDQNPIHCHSYHGPLPLLLSLIMLRCSLAVVLLILESPIIVVSCEGNKRNTPEGGSDQEMDITIVWA
jgi:hypothetical protein